MCTTFCQMCARRRTPSALPLLLMSSSVRHVVVLNDGCPEWNPSLHGTISPIVPLCDMANNITTCFSQSLETGLCITTSCKINFHPGAWTWLLHFQTMYNATQSNTTITTHCTTATELVLSGTDDSNVTWRTFFKLQQCCYYFVSNPCISVFLQEPFLYISIVCLFLTAAASFFKLRKVGGLRGL
jgi:hypothetical protein